MPTEPMTSERKIDQSASSPATQVPATMPSPKTSSKTGTEPSESPPTSVTVGAM